MAENEIPEEEDRTNMEHRNKFEPRTLDKSPISLPLLADLKNDKENKPTRFKSEETDLFRVIIDLNLRYIGGRQESEKRVRQLIGEIRQERPEYSRSAINENISKLNQQYIFADLHGFVIEELVRRDIEKAKESDIRPAIYRIWPDFPVEAFINKSISTIKADAAHFSFSASGKDITWAVVDSGIDPDHAHFKVHKNIYQGQGEYHCDFSGGDKPLVDSFGHGTHVAGIIAGQLEGSEKSPINMVTYERSENGDSAFKEIKLESSISGMAPACQLVSLKVLDEKGNGYASALIAAISHVQEINGYGRDIKIHGVNLSLGYNFEPEWFACGQSPLCVEVDRLVKSGVVVVVAAGNTGFGIQKTRFRGNLSSGMMLSINDPGNADLAITVGSTHRDMPHTYGISYFSSKGPTGDGRIKPDLVAPGEKIVSCAAGANKGKSNLQYEYIEDSGTSMAAPHVSGVIAAFLSIRREFIGKPEKVKEIFMSTATDLKRDRYFQGNGLVDLIRAIQSV